MLVSNRKLQKGAENIVVKVRSIQGDKVPLVLTPPRKMPVHRQEVREEIRRMFLLL